MMGVSKKAWGRLSDGSEVDLFTLTHARGMRAAVTTYGATLVKLCVPDGRGRLTDVILGYDNLADYRSDCCYFGCIVGRVANRIARARFRLKGDDHVLDANYGVHHLHGGEKGFNTRLWSATPGQTSLGPSLTLEYISHDGDQGYPGKLVTTVTYLLTKDSLRLNLTAHTNRTTVVNLTCHAYFNLSGDPENGLRDHEVTLYSHRYLPTDDDLIPLGKIADVQGTRMDFILPVRLGDRIQKAPCTDGYDHFYLLDTVPGKTVPTARVYHPPSGRILEVSTTQPGVHFYTGGGIPQEIKGKKGKIYGPGAGLCLETQGYPDAPNHPGFPSIVLKPGEKYEHSTEYRFPEIRINNTSDS